MTRTSLLIVLAMTGIAAAQPVTYKLRGDVEIGDKPALELRATQALTDLRLELTRDDGKSFTSKHRGLAKGQALTLPIGDGNAGIASYTGTLSADVTGKGRWSGELTFQTTVRAPMKVTYDADHLDLDKRELQFKLSRPIHSAELAVFGEDGAQIGSGSAAWDNTDKAPAPDTWVPIRWTQAEGKRVMTMKLRVVATDKVATNVELVPWSVTIDHEDVVFATDSAVIERSEQAKLDASIEKIADVVKRSGRFMKMKLFVAGHTDTVGPDDKNLKLSHGRARAIAAYFRRRGVKLPIVYAGFGERVLKVKTADSTDEAANRRADYVLGPASGAPPFKGPYLKARASWQSLQ